jgi:hypothetical protein
MGISEYKEKWRSIENQSHKILAEIFPNLQRFMDIWAL